MLVVLAITTLVSVNYHHLYARFPDGGGDAAATGTAFGEAWAFVPLAALVVDYALTISISVAAGASAIIAYVPRLAAERLPIAAVLVLAVAAVTWFGHSGRALFAAMTIMFIVVATAVIATGLVAPWGRGPTGWSSASPPHVPPVAVLLAFPVGMALATGVEAPSSAIAQLAQVGDAERTRFGRVTLWITLAAVAWLTLGLTVLSVRLHVGLPQGTSTQVAAIAKSAAGRGTLFALFQLASALLLLAAASSSFQAGPGVLKALAGGSPASSRKGLLPHRLGQTNKHHTPYWGVVVFLLIAAAILAAARAEEQELVLFYAVAVFISFMFGLVAMATFSWHDGRWAGAAVNLTGALAVAVTLGVNLVREFPIVSVAATAVLASCFYALWVRAGRPRGIAAAAEQAS
jgi:cobalamin synthase